MNYGGHVFPLLVFASLFLLITPNAIADNVTGSDDQLVQLSTACGRNPGINCQNVGGGCSVINYLTECYDTGDQICKAKNENLGWEATSCRYYTSCYWWVFGGPQLDNCQARQYGPGGIPLTGWYDYYGEPCGSLFSCCEIDCYPPCDSPQLYKAPDACGGCNVDFQCQACTPNNYIACYDNDRYWFDSCDNLGNLAEDCGNSGWDNWSYYCQSDDVYRTRTYYDRGCSGGNCYANPTNTQTELVQDCGEDSTGSWSNYCQDNDVYRTRTIYDRGCSGGSCFENTSTQTELVEDCGEDETEPWSAPYCSGNEVRRSRTVHDRGCSAASCFDNTTQEEETIENCGTSSWDPWTNICQSDDVHRTRDHHNRGCSAGSCFDNVDNTQTQFVEDCGEDGWDDWSFFCQANDVFKTRDEHDRGCGGGSCFDNIINTDTQLDQDCGETTYGSWGPYHCDGSTLVRERTNILRWCDAATCFEDDEVEVESQDCLASGLVCEGGTCATQVRITLQTKDSEGKKTSIFTKGEVIDVVIVVSNFSGEQINQVSLHLAFLDQAPLLVNDISVAIPEGTTATIDAGREDIDLPALAPLQSGTYELKAEAVTSSFATYLSPTKFLTIVDEIRDVPVPEINLLLVLFIAITVVALIQADSRKQNLQGK